MHMVAQGGRSSLLVRVFQEALREVRYHADPANQPPLEIAPARNLAQRAAFTATGLVLLGIGGVGAVTPVMPTWPFVLVALFSFARSSERVRRWLVGNPIIRTVYSLVCHRQELPFVIARRALHWLTGAAPIAHRGEAR